MVLCTIIVGIIWIVVFALSLKRTFSRYWIIGCVVQFFGLFFWSGGMDMDDHGGINRFSFTLTILVLSFCYGSGVGLKKLWKTSKLAFGGLFLSFLGGIVIFYFLRVRNSCDGWEYGLGGHKLLNNRNQ